MALFAHNIEPLYDADSKVLILGSFPSVKSRESAFYYANPRNRFWQVLSGIFQQRVPVTETEKRRFVLSHSIALWDIVKECEIKGSSDNALTAIRLNDLSPIFKGADIKAVFLNGKKAYSLFAEPPGFNREIYCLPSTSPANASYSLLRLLESWRVIKRYV